MLEQNSPALYIANVEDAATIAGVLTAPPRGAGPGRGAAAPAPATPQPATAQTPPAAGAPAAPAPAGGGRGRGNATGHTPAHWLKVAAYPDGTFTITNPRNGFSKTYAARTPPRPTK